MNSEGCGIHMTRIEGSGTLWWHKGKLVYVSTSPSCPLGWLSLAPWIRAHRALRFAQLESAMGGPTAEGRRRIGNLPGCNQEVKLYPLLSPFQLELPGEGFFFGVIGSFCRPVASLLEKKGQRFSRVGEPSAQRQALELHPGLGPGLGFAAVDCPGRPKRIPERTIVPLFSHDCPSVGARENPAHFELL